MVKRIRVFVIAALVSVVWANVGASLAAEAVSERKAKSPASPPLALKVKGTQILNSNNNEITATLVVKTDQQDNLTGEWQGQPGENKITDVKFEGDKLTFKSTTRVQGTENVCNFEGTI